VRRKKTGQSVVVLPSPQPAVAYLWPGRLLAPKRSGGALRNQMWPLGGALGLPHFLSHWPATLVLLEPVVNKFPHQGRSRPLCLPERS
jgi:hypothetical protein